MRLGSIISETLRNIASGTAHALAMFLAVLFAAPCSEDTRRCRS